MTAHVDHVVADAPVRVVDQGVGLCFRACVVDDGWRLALKCAMWSHVVVVANDVFEDQLQLTERVRGTFGEELLQRPVPALDLATGLGMVGTRVLVEDAGDNQVALEAGASVARSGVVDRAVEFLRDVKSK